MSTTNESLAAVARERIATRFEQGVAEVRRRLAELQRELSDLEAAHGTIRWEVTDVGAVYLNIVRGRMTVTDTPVEEPFMVVQQSPADWERLARGSVGPALVAGGRGGLSQARIERLKSLTGSVRFVISGLAEGDWSTIVRFGAEEDVQQPQATVRLAAGVVEQILSGQLTPQMAVMQGMIRMEGNSGFAIQVGAALAM